MTYNKKYGNDINEAILNGGTNPDVLAVFGAFFKVGDYNKWYENILDGKRRSKGPIESQKCYSRNSLKPLDSSRTQVTKLGSRELLFACCFQEILTIFGDTTGA